ncbi:MAG: hypothetical protein ACE14T_11605 [Syntrophales bacterium]
MPITVHKIRRSFFVPFVIDTVLVLVLLFASLFKTGLPVEIVILAIASVSMLLVSFELGYREIVTDDEGLRIRKLFRARELKWAEITHVGAVVLGRKAYIVLTTTKGFYIISNTYDGFYSMVRSITEHAGADRVEERVTELIQNPARKMADIISAWVAAVVILGIIYVRIFLS